MSCAYLQNDSLERLFSYENTFYNRHHSYIVITVIYVRILILSKNDLNVCIDDFIRDVICIIFTRYIVSIGNKITINKQRLESMSQEYPEIFIEFIEEFKNIKPHLVN